MSNMYDNITGRSPIATDDLGYIGTGNKASDILSNGTTDYNDLNNKPTINNVELKGNKTSSDLGLQPVIDSTHKLSPENISFTEGQSNALNSGITSTDVEKIETNKNNISSLTLHGSKNNDVNTVGVNEFAMYEPTAPNLPIDGYTIVRTSIYSATAALQEAFITSSGDAYIRTKAGGTWGAWKKITP